MGETWVSLRLCLICGHVGCCDGSKNKHATEHFHSTGHPLILSMEPGEDWAWCYEDEVYLELTSEITGLRDQKPGDAKAVGVPPVTGAKLRSEPLLSENRAARRVVWSYLLISGLYTLAASLIWGVNTLFLLGAGLNIFQVFIANSIYTASMVLFEIPTGVMADTRGRRASFLASVAILAAGTLGYVEAASMGGGLLLFGLMSVVLGLGFTFYSGAVEAWLVDALRATGYSGQLDRVFARGAIISGGAMLLGTLSGGLLGQANLSEPFLARSGLLAVLFIVAMISMHDIGFTPRKLAFSQLPEEMKRVAKESVQYGWRERPVRLLIGTSFIQNIFLAWGFYAWQPYFLKLLGKNVTWVAGVIAALISLATIFGNSIVEWLARYCRKRTTLLLWAIGIQAIAAIGVGLAHSFWLAVSLYLIVMAATGVFQPVKQAYLHQVIPTARRATVVSFDSLVGSGGSVAGQAGLGYLSEVQSIGTGYVTGGLAILLALPVLAMLRRLEQPADRIIGEAGKRSACAAQGIPDVSTLETENAKS